MRGQVAMAERQALVDIKAKACQVNCQNLLAVNCLTDSYVRRVEYIQRDNAM